MKTEGALDALSALAQESRLAAFHLLVGVGPDGLAAGEIANELGVPGTTLSFHLKHLAHADLVTIEREGRVIRYRANFDRMNALISYLSDHCCGGDAAACAPKPKPRKRGRRSARRASAAS